MTRRPWLLAYILLVTGLLTWRFEGWAYDDIFITYRYSVNLAHGAGMVYNLGERVLSTTAPLWAVVLALPAGLGWDVHAFALMIGAVCLALGGLCLWQMAMTAHQPWAAWTGLLLYPVHPLVYTTLGSETPLYLALGLGALTAQQHRHYLLAAGCAGLAALARPDGLLFVGVLALDWLRLAWLAKQKAAPFRFPWQASLTFSLICLPWILWATAYFGSPIPVTLAAKQQQGQLNISSSFLEGLWQTGWGYWHQSYFQVELILVVLGAVYVVWWMWRNHLSRKYALEPVWGMVWLSGWTAVYLAAFAALGVTRYFWYYAPLLPALVMLTGLGLAALERWLRWYIAPLLPALVALSEMQLPNLNQLVRSGLAGWKRVAQPLPGILAGFACVICLVGQGKAMVQQPFDTRYPVYRQVGEWLAAHTPADASVGTLEVGMIGYFSQRKIIDFGGLIQPEIALQLTERTNYEDAALWAVQQYHPEFLALQDRGFPRLETWAKEKGCQESARFPGPNWDMVVYTCR